MLTNVFEYDGINLLTFHIMLSPILRPHTKPVYLGKALLVFCLKFHFAVKCLDLNNQKVKTGYVHHFFS